MIFPSRQVSAAYVITVGVLVLQSGCSGSDSSADGQAGDGPGQHGDALRTDAAWPEGEDAGPPRSNLILPEVIDLPYVTAGGGGCTVDVSVANQGDMEATGPGGGALVWQLDPSPHPDLTLVAAPATVPAGGQGTLTLAYAGSTSETIVQGRLVVSSSDGQRSLPVYAVAGHPELGAASWAQVIGAGGVSCGEGTTVGMPAAPFPDGEHVWNDDSVRVFLPQGWRDLPTQDMVIHFHGHATTLAETLAYHRYQEHLYASGQNAILVVPQGPVNYASGDFGKLMHEGGLARLAHQVLVLLYRDGRVRFPSLATTTLTSHSGGYQAVAVNLQFTQPADLDIVQVGLFDSLYGYASTYRDYALLAGRRLRSNYTATGQTLDNNLALKAALEDEGHQVAAAATTATLRDASTIIFFADSSHQDATRSYGVYGEELRWGLPRSRRGPRVELRQAVAIGGSAMVGWRSPHDVDLEGFDVEISSDGASWQVAASASADAVSASFAFAGGARVRVRPRVQGVAPAAALTSDVYRIDADADILVVDGFDRVLDGSFAGLTHDFAARLGEAAGGAATISHRAITEDGFALAPYGTVLWLAGDQSTADRSLTVDERVVLGAYLAGGGRFIASGSEIAYDLHATSAGSNFLSSTFGAGYVADNSGSYSVVGAGDLAGMGPFAYGGVTAPYRPLFPDVLSAGAGAEVLLRYGSNQVAAVGLAGRSALVAFPLETCDAVSDLAAIMAGLLAFVSS